MFLYYILTHLINLYISSNNYFQGWASSLALKTSIHTALKFFKNCNFKTFHKFEFVWYVLGFKTSTALELLLLDLIYFSSISLLSGSLYLRPPSNWDRQWVYSLLAILYNEKKSKIKRKFKKVSKNVNIQDIL